jgi:hypothetical protein
MFGITQKEWILVVLGAVAGLIAVGLWSRAKFIPSIISRYFGKLDSYETQYGQALAEDTRRAIGLLGFLICTGVGMTLSVLGVTGLYFAQELHLPGVMSFLYGICVGIGLVIFNMSGRFSKMARVAKMQGQLNDD